MSASLLPFPFRHALHALKGPSLCSQHLKANAMLRLAHEPSSHAVTKPIAWGSDQYLQPIAVKALLRYEGEGAARLRMELAEHR